MYSETALAIHRTLPVVDGHNDLPWKLRTEADGPFHTDIDRMLAGGVGAQFWSVYVPSDIEGPFRQTMQQIDLVESMVAGDDRLALARTASEARAIRERGRIASLIGAEGGHCIEGSLGNLATLASRGVRYMTLTHSDTTEWADSATDTALHDGLTSFGREVVREMNRLGMLVDISHVSAATMRDALDESEVPVIASHSNAYTLAPHPRNIPDDVLREIGDRGGVVMVVFYPGFLVAESAVAANQMFDDHRALREQFAGDEKRIAIEWESLESQTELERGSVDDLVDHVEYISGLAGVDAVGLGSDFDGMPLTPVGLEDVSSYPSITDELLRRGWAESDIRKVLGENTLRVLEAAG